MPFNPRRTDRARHIEKAGPGAAHVGNFRPVPVSASQPIGPAHRAASVRRLARIEQIEAGHDPWRTDRLLRQVDRPLATTMGQPDQL